MANVGFETVLARQSKQHAWKTGEVPEQVKFVSRAEAETRAIEVAVAVAANARADYYSPPNLKPFPLLQAREVALDRCCEEKQPVSISSCDNNRKKPNQSLHDQFMSL